jgi:hypothetical protein
MTQSANLSAMTNPVNAASGGNINQPNGTVQEDHLGWGLIAPTY